MHNAKLGAEWSLLLSRRTLAFPASCRFIPAHILRDFASTEIAVAFILQAMFK
jgi:hypothetical protein